MNKKKFGTMDIILVFVAVAVIAFTAIMVKTFWMCGSIPDTLCNCVFAVLGGECGAMAWIKTTKERHRERAYEKEDRKYYDNKNNEG